MNNKILISFLISMLAGLSTLIGCLFIFIKPKNINKFIGISLSFSATIMILISLLELIPDGFSYLSNKYGYIYSLILLIIMLLSTKSTSLPVTVPNSLNAKYVLP